MPKPTVDVPLMITATPNPSWTHPDAPAPDTVGGYVDELAACRDAGASIAHLHAEDWPTMIAAVRARTDLLVECGISGATIEDRLPILEAGADMITVCLNHMDESFEGGEFHDLHPREELARYGELTKEHGVVPSWEVWHTGSIWNLHWLIERGLAAPTFFITLFFGCPGGVWAPPTVQEYLWRRAQLPEDSVVSVAVLDPGQKEIAAAAIARGDHVRIGTEDLPLGRDGEFASASALVREAAEVAESLGRPLATPAQARELCGLTAVEVAS
jgi:3-keto-5-aminohexanoate cleavage enzyme